MNQTELFNKLINAYSDENLNFITGKLIDLYKRKDITKLRSIANRISKFVAIDSGKDARFFSKLIVLYHPDKGAANRKMIEKHYRNNDLDSLTCFSHILQIENIDFDEVTVTIDEEVDYNAEYNWDENQEDGFQFFEDENNDNLFVDEPVFEEDEEKTFYEAVKLRMYGNPEMEFPTYYLEDFEDFEMASQGIVSLDGIQYCKHATSIDVSDNLINDISELRALSQIQELYLANNNIGYIDVLSNLLDLISLDLSGNQVDDISPLFELENLEYVNLIGNNISDEQIAVLRKKGILTMY